MSRRFQGAAAIVGVGQTELSKDAGRSETQLASEESRSTVTMIVSLPCFSATNRRVEDGTTSRRTAGL
ncbi:MAG: hypothetical protein JWM05_1193 [Acidimicrobiales bacterium]|nr:hypothetical protein [Acidimicrobiales bacterium]